MSTTVKNAIFRRRDGFIALDVVMHINVLYVDVTATQEIYRADEAIMSKLEAGSITDSTIDVHEGTLLRFYQ